MIMVNFLTPITCIGVGSWLKIEPSQSKTSDSYDTPFTRASPQVWYYAQRIGSSICIKDGVILAISIAIFSSIPLGIPTHILANIFNILPYFILVLFTVLIRNQSSFKVWLEWKFKKYLINRKKCYQLKITLLLNYSS